MSGTIWQRSDRYSSFLFPCYSRAYAAESVGQAVAVKAVSLATDDDDDNDNDNE